MERSGKGWMSDERKVRREKECLELGGTRYHIEALQGKGESAIIYRAYYADTLNPGQRHSVYIKELYPRVPGNAIYRGEDGSIYCTLEGKEELEYHRKRFYQGYQANRMILEKEPEQGAETLNLYEAYGTYYSVLSGHRRTTLGQLLVQGKYQNLREAAELVLQILDSLECFHNQGILHLDINPDNILVFMHHVLLIDYNSVWILEGKKISDCVISEKEDYSAPEVLLHNWGQIRKATDLYSVCAVFFQLVTGRALTEKELIGNGLPGCFSEKMQSFHQMPVTAVQKAVQIICKGLHTLPKKRFQSVKELRVEIQDLLQRIDGQGITWSALWEASRTQWKKTEKKRKSQEDFLLKRYVCMKESTGKLKSQRDRSNPDDQKNYITERIGQAEVLQKLQNGAQILLTGENGLGKTWYLKELWRQNTVGYSQTDPVVLYVPLADYQQTGEGAYYIREYILRHLCYTKEENMEEARHKLDRLLETAGNQGNSHVILLLDGLNEAGRHRSRLMKEIEELGAFPGVGVLVTDEVQNNGLQEFCTVNLLPLERIEVQDILAKRELDADESPMELLNNPMLLQLYCETMCIAAENGKPWQESKMIRTADELAEQYLDNLCVREQRIASGELRQQLLHRYLLKHLLPEIGQELYRNGQTVLSQKQLRRLSDINYRQLRDKNFGRAFREYLGKSRIMLKDIKDGKEWFDFAVEGQLTENMALLVKTEEGNYRLIYDRFQNSLARMYDENHKKIVPYRRRGWMVKGVFAAALFAAACGTGVYFYSNRGLSEEQKKVISRALMVMGVNLGNLDRHITVQRNILGDAGMEAVYEGNPLAMEQLKERIAYSQREIAVLNARNMDYVSQAEKISENNLDEIIPLDIYQELCGKSEEMALIMEDTLSYLEASLCDPNSVYVTEESRRMLVEPYQKYLDTYLDVCYKELNLLFLDIGEESSELMELLSITPNFIQYVATEKQAGTREELEQQLQVEKKRLYEAEVEMQPYEVEVFGN